MSGVFIPIWMHQVGFFPKIYNYYKARLNSLQVKVKVEPRDDANGKLECGQDQVM